MILEKESNLVVEIVAGDQIEISKKGTHFYVKQHVCSLYDSERRQLMNGS